MQPAIVVTGASSGIGRELVRVAAPERSFMLLISRSQEPLDVLVAQLERSGTPAAALYLDLEDHSAGERIEAALAEHGRYCDVLVNCAGFGVFGPTAALDRRDLLGVLDVNARMLTDLSLRFLPGMLARGRGGILNVGSLTGYAPGGPYLSLYYATKAYVRSFSAALAAEVAGTGVTVCYFAPGVVRTPFFDRCKVGETRLFKMAPRSNAAATAKAGWRGFRAGKRVVIPRWADWLIASMCSKLPERVVLWIVATFQRPASGAKESAQVSERRG